MSDKLLENCRKKRLNKEMSLSQDKAIEAVVKSYKKGKSRT